jgi:hypothetical protein
MIATKNKQRLLVAFQEKNNSIKRLANFFSAIDNHIDESVTGVIINFEKERIQVIFTYENEKDEKNNYFDYKRDEVPYFVFSYSLVPGDPTHSQYIYEPFEHPDLKSNREDLMSLRVSIQEIKSLNQFLTSVMNDYSSLFFKAKTIVENEKKVNVLLFQADKGIYINRNFKIKTMKLTYEIIAPYGKDDGWISIKTVMTPLKIIADKWKNKMQVRKKESDKYFLIKLHLVENPPNGILYIKFFYSKLCKFTLKYSADFEIDQSYNFDFEKFYEVKMEHFLKIITDHNLNNYSSKFCIKFVLDEIILGFYTNGLTTDEKYSNVYKLYSDYCVRIPAKCTADQERIDAIFEDAD